ncbi:MAG: SPOR domain-containing protein [Candidatus Accumulibacter sp.]|nr:SPOR domain-containing protein [Accumulibacter sp.]
MKLLELSKELYVRKKSLEDGELSGIRRKLIMRMVFAVLMIVALLGGLALFDRFNSPQADEDDDEPAAFTPPPAPVPQRRPDPPPAPLAPVETPPPASVETPGSAPSATPEGGPAPDAGSPEVPKPDAPQAVPTAPTGAPVVEAPGAGRAPSPTPTIPLTSPIPQIPPTGTRAPEAAPTDPSRRPRPPIRPAPSATPVVEGSAAPVDRAIPKVDAPPGPEISPLPVLPPSRTRAPDGRAPVAGQSLPPTTRITSGFALQAGVFADPRRAEELHARLTLEGIPSTIEARVHVGPFKNKAEMAEAQAKLKALGIDAVTLNPGRGRR